MRLGDVAHARAGDKGDVSQISVIAYRAEDFVHLRAEVTPERVRAHFGAMVQGAVERYELPQLGILNFVMRGALASGVTRSLALDAHGKCLGFVLLDMQIADRGVSPLPA